MKRHGLFLICVAALPVPVPAQEGVPDRVETAITTPRFDPAKFVQWLEAQKADAKVIESFQTDWSQGPDGRVTDRAVRAVARRYARAMELVEDGDPKGALELGKVLAKTEDPVIRAHARYFLARTLLNEDDPEGAAELLKDFIRFDRGHSWLDGEAAFYLGYALSLVPSVEDAILNLDAFLKLYEDAPERYRMNADRLLQELKAQWKSPLHGIADDMKWCERRLKKEQAGEPVEVRQLDILERLQQLIEELEKQQQQGGGAPSGNQIPSGPASQSKLPPGEGRVGQLHGSRGVKDRWGSMPDKDRQKIFNELQNKLPERYRVLLENYYKRINKPDGQ